MEVLKVKKNKKNLIEKAVQVLKSGGLIIYPTETCYGAGVLATNQEAVNRLLKYKKRPFGKPISVAVSRKNIAERYVKLNSMAEDAYKNFLPGPVTVISKYKGGLANGLSSEFGTLGIRIPDYDLTLDLLDAVEEPITSTSANSAGKKTPYSIDDVLNQISDSQEKLIDLIIDAGKLPKNPPSTVIDTTKGDMQVLRTGRIAPGSVVTSRTIKNEREMQNLGAELVRKTKGKIKNNGLVIVFNAELGAGKTQFTKGIAAELGVEEIVKSPTYSIIEEYDFEKGTLIHIDAWRLENLSELKQLLLERKIKPGNILVIEWSGGAEDYLIDVCEAKKATLISLSIDYIDQNTRKVRIIES